MEKANLVLCNLTSRGMTLAEARAHLAGEEVKKAEKAKVESTKEETPKKETAAEKKARVAVKIEALGGEVPAKSQSFAKFQEALTAAMTAKAEREQKEADEAQADADKEQAEADEAKAEADAAKELL
jgi:hypothetical protein